ncbi:MAG: hypothetical protein IPM14_06365 [bacterium]|nr:hypothetical protein [bacterium]
MDNFFEILIYLIIIISFLSSIFKKKKQQPQKKPPVQQPQRDDYYQAEQPEVSIPQTQQKEEYDILKELEDFFKVGDEQTEVKVPRPQETYSENIPTADEHVSTETWKEDSISENIRSEWERKKEEVSRKLAKVDSVIEKQAEMFETSLERKELVFSNLAITVRSKFSHPDTLKEYILFSEILGKPKALRR